MESTLNQYSHLPIMEVAPFFVTMTTVFEPTANFSNLKTPTGPFQTMVAALSMTVVKVAMDS